MKVNGKALLGRVSTNAEPRIQGRVKRFEINRDLLANCAPEIIFNAGSESLWELVPEYFSKKVSPRFLERAQGFFSGFIQINQPPFVVQGQKAISDAFENIGDALIRFLQRLLGFNQLPFRSLTSEVDRLSILQRNRSKQRLLVLIPLHYLAPIFSAARRVPSTRA